MTELLEILLSWAILFSPYGEAPIPVLETKPHSFFVEHACGGKECNVLGWYNDTGVVYLDENISENLHDELLLHELVHYLQDVNGDYDSESCEDSLKREREAYLIQSRYMVEAVGRLPRPVNHNVSCNKYK